MSSENGIDASNGSEKRNPSEQKPIIPKYFIKECVQRLYGMTVLDWTELNSYDDKNYHLTVDIDVSNTYIVEFHHAGYVLKILNSEDSKTPVVIDALHKLFEHLHNKGLAVQQPVHNVNGHTWSVETVPDENNLQRENGPYVFQLLRYIEGDIIIHKPYLPATLYNVGVFAGRMHKALKDFEHNFYKDRSFIWSLKEMSGLVDYTCGVKDPQNLKVVMDVIQAFEEEVVPKYHALTEGYIHGDINEQNILVKEIADDSRECDVTAFIDFTDMTYSYIVFDIAIVIAYLSLDCKEFDQLDVGGHVLAGYMTEMTLNPAEIDVLRECICCRLVQSLVMGSYSYEMEPSNTYTLATSKRGWPLLWKFWRTPKSDLYSRWNTILNDYNSDHCLEM